MTRLSAAMVRMLAMVPDGPIVARWDASGLRTVEALVARGLVQKHSMYANTYSRTPFGRETAERLARRAEK